VRDIAQGQVAAGTGAATLRKEPRLDWFPLPGQSMPPRQCFLGEQESMPLEEAGGRICAEIVTPYPPGIPVLMPGEQIDARILQNLMTLRQAGCPVSASTPTLSHILVSTAS
jgi:arginine/lysine/ornithine decarboxylase